MDMFAYRICKFAPNSKKKNITAIIQLPTWALDQRPTDYRSNEYEEVYTSIK
jgi:hypothetical protein